MSFKEYHTTVQGRPLTIYKDEEIHIPTYTIHHDPKYYPDPQRFDPERFSKVNHSCQQPLIYETQCKMLMQEAKASRHPMAFLGFGQGPRNCIGLRFALIENKIALTKLLPLYEFVPGKDTPRHHSHMTSANKAGSFWQINSLNLLQPCRHHM